MDDFVHISKTAGSSIRTILGQQYGLEKIAYFEPESPQLKGRNALDKLREDMSTKDVRLITGHHLFGIHSDLNRTVRYFSMVRDPISRAVSDYFYAYIYPQHHLHDKVVSGALRPFAYLADGQKYGIYDVQSRFLKGNCKSRGFISDAAIEVILNCFVFVGVTELFDESMLLMAKKLGWLPPLYVSRNTTALMSDLELHRRRVEDRTRLFLSENFSPDIALHKSVTNTLISIIRSEGTAFVDAFTAYRELQEFFQKKDVESSTSRYEFGPNQNVPSVTDDIRNSEPYRVVQDYLNNHSTPAPRNYVGHVDAISSGQMVGWAADLSRNFPISVNVFNGDRFVASSLASEYRSDVERARGIRGNVGFRISFPDVGDATELNVCFESTRIQV